MLLQSLEKLMKVLVEKQSPLVPYFSDGIEEFK
jgi:hypothetical protein